MARRLNRSAAARAFAAARLLIGAGVLATAPIGAGATPEPAPISPPPTVVTADWTDRIEIDAVGRNGAIAPTLAVAHDKTVVDGALGQGFRLAGPGAVRHASSTGGAPQHTSASRLTLDGAELIPLSGGAQPVYAYAADDGTRITYAPADNVFIAVRDGWRRTYGSLGGGADDGRNATLSMPSARASRRAGPLVHDLPGVCADAAAPPALCDTAEWRLARVEDPFGNRILYDYARPDPAPGLAARYGAGAVDPVLTGVRWETAAGAPIGSIELDYAVRDDAQLDYSGGAPRLSAHRLTDIRSFARGALRAHYGFEYQDEPGLDCDGAPAVAADGAARSRLRRIWRISVDAPQARRQLRCIQTEDAPVDAGSWADPVATELLTPGSGAYDLVAVVPATLNDDALSDLIVLREDGQHEAFVASRPGGTGDMFDFDPGEPALAALRGRLRARLTEAYFDGGYGWSLLDFDRDGRPDLLSDDIGADRRQLDRFDPRTGLRISAEIPLSRCDLIAMRTADIDGDGFVDLVLPPRAAETAQTAPDGRPPCGARSGAEWIRNLGREPWFDPSDAEGAARPLELPLLGVQLGAIAQGGAPLAGEIRVAGMDVAPPFGDALWPTPRQFVVDQMRFSDANGDGIDDVLVSLHRRWEVARSDGSLCDPATPGLDDGRCQWRAVEGGEFTRIFWGDGYGAFVDSGLSAGPPLYDHGELGSSTNYFTTYRALADLQRSGRAAMLVGDGIGVRVEAVAFRGVAYGFGEEPLADDGSAPGARLADGGRLPFADYPYTPCPTCKSGAYQPVLADFDGDGFSDLLEVRVSRSGTFQGGACAGRRRCISLAYAERDTAQGRVVAADGPWGGRTRLNWRFYGEDPGDDGVTRPVEVLAREDGAQGERRFAYGRARERDGGLDGFGLAAVRRAAGGVDVFASALSETIFGAPLYAARYRADFTLEAASVFAHGAYASGRYAIAAQTPAFNPRARDCAYLVERQPSPPRIADLIKDCWGWGGRNAPSHNQLLALAGFDPAPASAVGPIADLADGAPPGGPAEAALAPAGGDGKALLWEIAPPAPTAPVGPRWPTAIAFDPPPDPETLQQSTPQSAFGSGFRRFVTDWEYDAATQRPARKLLHRDTRRATDDLLETYRWERVPNAAGARLLESRQLDRRGRVLRTAAHRDFVGLQTPRVSVDCGRGGADCRQIQRVWSPEGLEISRTEVEAGRRTAFAHDVACGLTQSTDALNRVESRSYDARCRMTRRDVRGAITEQIHDGFGRVAVRTVTPSAGAEPIVTTYGYDDALAIREDRGFDEPRLAVQSPSGLRLSYLDGFGRAAKVVLCNGRPDAAPDGVGYACEAGPRHVVSRTLYRSDGLVYADAAPFIEGAEPPAFTHVALRDGLGRALVTDRPNGDALGGPPSWSRDVAYFAPLRRITVDAVGVERLEQTTTLTRERRVAGRPMLLERMDALGRVTRRDAANAPSYVYAYDARGRLSAMSRAGRAPIFEPAQGAAAIRGWARRFAHDPRDKVAEVIEPDGSRVAMTHDALGRITRREITDASTGISHVETWRYEDGRDGRDTTISVDRNGATRRETRDGIGRLLETVGPTGVAEQVAHLPEANRIERTRADGSLTLSTATDFDLGGAAVAETGADGLTAKIARNGRGLPTETLDPSGATIRTLYAQSGAMRERRRMRGAVGWSLASRRDDPVGRPALQRLSGVRVETDYDDLGRMVARRRGAGAAQTSMTLTYDGDGRRITSQTLQVGAGPLVRATLSYDAWRRVATQSDAEGGQSVYAYDYFDRVAQVVDPTRAAFQARYDYFDRPLRHVLPGGVAVDYAYEPVAEYAYRHNPRRTAAHLEAARRTDAAGAETTTWTDPLGRVVAQTSPVGVTTEFVYDGARLAQAYIIGAGGDVEARIDRVYDAAGRLAAVLGPDDPAAFGGDAVADPSAFGGYAVRYAYGADGRLSEIDAAGERTEFAYDGQSGLLSATLYRGLREEVARTRPSAAANRPLRVTGRRLVGRRGAVRTTSYRFDSLGRRIAARIAAGGQTEELRWAGFDANGRSAQEIRVETDARGARREVALDWTYDLRGLPLSRRLTIDGASYGRTVWSWDARGLKSTAQGVGGEAITYIRRPDRRLEAVRYGAGQTLAGQVTERDAVGRPLRIETPGGAVETDWAPDGLVAARRRLGASGELLQVWEPSYDGVRKLAAETWTEGGDRSERTYAYDGALRLIGETYERGGARTELEYRLNPAGLRLETRRDGAAAAEMAYDPLLRLVSVNGEALKYDDWDGVAAGRGGSTFTRSASGLIASVKTEAGLTRVFRDANGTPVAQETPGRGFEVLDFGLDPSSPPLSRQAVGGASPGATTYVRGFGLLLARPDGRAPAGAVGDGLFSPVGSVVDGESEATATSAFGAPLSKTEPAPFAFAGLDVAPGGDGLYLARMRGYDSVTGQFLSLDPVGLRGGLHRTRYAEADPVRYADPLGLWACAATPSDPGGPPPLLPDLIDPFANTPDFTFGDGITAETRAYWRLLAIGIDISFQPVLPGAGGSDGASSPIVDQCLTYCPPPGSDGGDGVVIGVPPPAPGPDDNPLPTDNGDSDPGDAPANPGGPPETADEDAPPPPFPDDFEVLQAEPTVEYVPLGDVLEGLELEFEDWRNEGEFTGFDVDVEALDQRTTNEGGSRRLLSRDGEISVPVLSYDPQRSARVAEQQRQREREEAAKRDPVRQPRWTDDLDDLRAPTTDELLNMAGDDNLDRTQTAADQLVDGVGKVAPGGPGVPNSGLITRLVDSVQSVWHSVGVSSEVIADPSRAPDAEYNFNQRAAEDAPETPFFLETLDDLGARGKEAREARERGY